MITAWMKNSRTEYVKITNKIKKKPASQIPKLTALQSWRLETFAFLKEHIRIKDEAKDSADAVMSDNASDDSDGSAQSQRSSISSLTNASSQMNLSADVHSDAVPGTSAAVFVPPAKAKSKKRLRASRDELAAAQSESSLNMLSKVLYDNTNTMSDTLNDLKEDQSDVRSSYLNYLKTEVKDMTETQWLQFKRQCNTSINRFTEERQLSTSGVSTFQYPAQTTPHNPYTTTQVSTSQMPYSYQGDMASAPLPPHHMQFRTQLPPFNPPPPPQRHVYPPLSPVPDLRASMIAMATPVRGGMSLPNSNLNTPTYPHMTTATATTTATTPTSAMVAELGKLVSNAISVLDKDENVSDVDVTNSAHNSDA